MYHASIVIIKKWFFYDLSYVLKYTQDIHSFFKNYNTLRSIIGLFFRYLLSIAFQLYLLTKELVFYNLCKLFSNFFMNWKRCSSCSVLKAFISIIDRIYCCFYVLYPIRKIHLQSTTIQMYFATFATQQINLIKSKIATFH